MIRVSLAKLSPASLTSLIDAWAGMKGNTGFTVGAFSVERVPLQ